MARWQLLALGVSKRQIDVRVARARLHEVHRGVYLVGHRIAPPYALETAAVLAARSEGTLGGRTATALWGMTPYPPPGDVCLIVPSGMRVARQHVQIRRVNLDAADIARVHGLPVTSPVRTILDVAAIIATEAGGDTAPQSSPALARRRLSELEQLVAQAEYLGLTSAAELAERLGREPGRCGARALRAVLELPGGAQRARSRDERRLITLLRRNGIDGFEANATIHGYEVDLLWRDLSFAVEVDGWDGHSGRIAFERDRVKLAQLSAHGVDVMPVTPREIRRAPDAVIGRIEAAVRRRRLARR